MAVVMARQQQNGDEPRTRSGKAVRATADAIRADLDEMAGMVHEVAEKTRLLADEVPGIPGILGVCRGLANQLDTVAQAYRERASEVHDTLTRGPRESVEPITVNVDPALAGRVQGERR